MKESFNASSAVFKEPNIANEEGEFERVASTFNIDSSVLMFQAQLGNLVELSDEVWSMLENTDSNRYEEGGWGKVEEYATALNRDWHYLRDKLSKGAVLDAPIIMKFGSRFHLVSGNTRLMVARAMGIAPTVFIFDVDMHDETQVNPE